MSDILPNWFERANKYEVWDMTRGLGNDVQLIGNLTTNDQFEYNMWTMAVVKLWFKAVA